MKCQILFSGKNISICRLLKILPRVLSVKKNMYLGTSITVRLQPASMAQSDARLTGDQAVLSLIPSGSGNFLSWRLIMK